MTAREDTIVALSSGPLPSALALVRVSGPDAVSCVEALLRAPLPSARMAKLRRLVDADGALIDEAVMTVFPGPNSFTGEDLCELTVHGGPAVVDHLLSALTSFASVRLAEPGEFTRRAFEAGHLNLTEAEAIADIVAAETRTQKAQALEQLSGRLADEILQLQDLLIDAMAACEVMIDFADEGDAPDDNREVVDERLAVLDRRLADILDDNRAGERLREGIRIAIIGPPNAGKSTLLNALAEEDAAIVSDMPGTTRDVVSVRIALGGVPVTLQDTAGMRSTNDAIEAEGVLRARRASQSADLSLLLIASGQETPPEMQGLSDDRRVIRVQSKSDLAPENQNPGLRVSAVRGEGIEELKELLARQVRDLVSSREPALITRARHREAFSHAKESISRARNALNSGLEIALVAEDIRAAAQQMERLLGRVDVEDVLGSIFSRFCIGK